MDDVLRERLELLRTCDTGNVADAYVRLGMVRQLGDLTVNGSRCKPLNFGDSFAGPAVTVRFAPLLPGHGGMGLFDVFEKSPAGSVVVMTGIPDRCYMGDVLAKYAAKVGIAAVVAEGFVRDSRGCARCGMPIFAAGGTAAAKGKEMYTVEAVNEPISFHGIPVHSGDILVGDCDGLIRVPPDFLESVCGELAEVLSCERMYDDVFAEYEGRDCEGLLAKLKAVSAKSH